MSHVFIVTFKDNQQLQIDDIIMFDDAQKTHIANIALEFTQQELKDCEYGIDLNYLTEDVQKPTILAFKNDIVGDVSSEILYSKGLVKYGRHSLERLLKRVGSDSVSTILNIIGYIKQTNTVHKGQFKGFPQLSYTLYTQNDSDHFKISISFEKVQKSERIIKVVTVSNVQYSQSSQLGSHNSEQRIADNPRLAKMMANIKKRLQKD